MIISLFVVGKTNNHGRLLRWLIFFPELYEREADGKKVIYWNVNYPWPMSNRDVSFFLFECNIEMLQNDQPIIKL